VTIFQSLFGLLLTSELLLSSDILADVKTLIGV
jgi:hypothetical protein